MTFEVIKEAYRKLTGQDPPAAVIKRLEMISENLDIKPDDALWSIFLGMELYDRIYEQQIERLRAALDNYSQKTPTQGWIWLSASLLGAVALGVICFIGGIALGSGRLPIWMDPQHPASLILKAPAGWIAVLVLSPWAGHNVLQRIKKLASIQPQPLSPALKKMSKAETFKLILSLLCLMLSAGIVLSFFS